jgi:hypothetical protein
VLIKEGTEGGRLCAAYVPEPCSFRDTITGVHGGASDLGLLKALAAFLNSSFATYLAFATTGWGIDRRRVKRGEVLSLPSQVVQDANAVSQLAKLFDRLVSTRGSRRKAQLEREIDEVVFDSLDVADGERALVRDMLQTSIDYVHRGSDSRALAVPVTRDLERYAEAFASVFGQVVSASGEKLTWTVYDGTTPLRVVSFVVSRSKNTGKVGSSGELADVLHQLDSRLWEREGGNLYRRRHVRVFEDRAVHIVKPAELRFWSESAAFHDADEVIAQSLAGDDNDAS